MELLFILLFATNLLELTEAKQVNNFEAKEEYEEEDDLFELPPDPSPVSGFADGPLPKFIELDLHVKYDLSLLEWFGGSKAATENYVQSIILLAKFHLQYTNLDIKIHIKVLLITSCYSYSMFVKTSLFVFMFVFCFVYILFSISLVIFFRLPVSSMFQSVSNQVERWSRP